MTWLFYVMGMMVSHDLRSPPVLKWHFLSSVTSNAATAVSSEKNINFTSRDHDLMGSLRSWSLVLRWLWVLTELPLSCNLFFIVVVYGTCCYERVPRLLSDYKAWKAYSYFDSKWLKEIIYREIFHDLYFLKATSDHFTASEVFLTRSVFTRGMKPCWVHTVLVCRVSSEEFHANFVTGIYRPYS